MKIHYSFCDGAKTDVEVSEEIGSVIMESRRLEHNLNERERNHCFSMELVNYEGAEFGFRDTYPILENDNELTEKINYALGQLTEVQKRRLFMLASGLNINQIAYLEKSSHQSVSESINSGRKKLKKFFKNF